MRIQLASLHVDTRHTEEDGGGRARLRPLEGKEGREGEEVEEEVACVTFLVLLDRRFFLFFDFFLPCDRGAMGRKDETR